MKMCILADQYDITPLKTIAINLSNRSANSKFINYDKEEYYKALKRAYDAYDATNEIREHMVNLMIKNNVMNFVTDDGAASEFELLMTEYGDLATDVAKVLHSRSFADNQKRTRCPSCTEVFVCGLGNISDDSVRYCNNCGYGHYAYELRNWVVD